MLTIIELPLWKTLINNRVLFRPRTQFSAAAWAGTIDLLVQPGKSQPGQSPSAQHWCMSQSGRLPSVEACRERSESSVSR